MSGRNTVRPHRDTVATMQECAEYLAGSMRDRLLECARRLEGTECAASAVPDHDEIAERILRDWDNLLDLSFDDVRMADRERMADLAAGAVPAAVVQLTHQQVSVAGDAPGLDGALRRAREVALRRGDWTLDWTDVDILVRALTSKREMRR